MGRDAKLERMPEMKEMRKNRSKDGVDIKAMFDIDDDVVQNSLESGMDLRECAAQIENELKMTQSLAVHDCIEQVDKLAELHEQINSCDAILENLEGMLSGFLSDLGIISTDMKRLKEQSVVINHQLNNRQKVRGELSQFVDDMVVPHIMIKIITEKDVNDSDFIEQLHELQHKLQFLKTQEFKDAKAVGDVHDVVESLKFKAMEKIREWLLMKISLFKKPLTNYQIPQNALLKNRFFYEFLLANDREVAREVKAEYVDTTSKMFFSYFKAYCSRLFKLQMSDSAAKDDLLGAEDASVKPSYSSAIPSIFYSKPHARSRATVFSLGNRQNLLSDDLMAPLIVPHASQQANETFQFESLFQSIQYALIDHCSHEFLFICDFFMVDGQPSVDLFTDVMGRTIAHLLKALDEKIAVNYDAISLFLCICLCTRYNQVMLERCVVSIDGYWESITKSLWSRFEVMMNLHNDSVRTFDIRKATVDTRPHYVIRRYAEFTYALLVCSQLSAEKIDFRLQSMLSKQQSEIEALLNRLTAQLRLKKDRLVFQINNYDVILTILDEKVAADSKERSSFWELQQTKIKSYVEEVLSPHFSTLIQFIHECEPLIEQNHTQLLQRYSNQVTQIVRSFGAEWKRSIEAINSEILQSFTNLKNGTNILQMAFTQFIQYYQRLNKVLSHEAFQKLQIGRELVNYQHITVELKKYKPLF